MIRTTDRTITYVKLSDLADEYAKKFHDPGTDSYDAVCDEFMEVVRNSTFTWGDNDATFVHLDKFCDVLRVEDIFDGAIVAPPSADIFVLLEE